MGHIGHCPLHCQPRLSLVAPGTMAAQVAAWGQKSLLRGLSDGEGRSWYCPLHGGPEFQFWVQAKAPVWAVNGLQIGHCPP